MQGVTTAECMVCGNNFHLANPSVLVSCFPSWLVLANILLLFWLTSVICTMTIDWRDNVITVLQGSVPFFIGLFLLFVRWPVAGIIMELYGSFVLFSGYGPPIQAFLYQIPIIGWILQYPFQLFAQLRRKRAWNLLQLPRYSLTHHGDKLYAVVMLIKESPGPFTIALKWSFKSCVHMHTLRILIYSCSE